jgi:hypothetical protein
MMRKLVIIGLILFGLIFVFGCSNVTNVGEIEGAEGLLAKVIIPLPTSENGRSVVPLASTQSLTNLYEVFFKRTDTETPNYYKASATSIENYVEIEVPVGTYNILIVAGYSSVGYGNYLLVSAYSQNEIIVLGENVVNMGLNPISYTLTSPASITIGEQFTVNVSIDTKNPLFTLTPNVIYTGSGMSSAYVDVSPDPSETTKSRIYTVNAPVSSGNEIIYFFGGFAPFNVETLGYWYFGPTNMWQSSLYFNDGPSTSIQSYASYFANPITFTALIGVPTIIINLIWNTSEWS